VVRSCVVGILPLARLPRTLLPGPSVSSDRLRSELRICDERFENRVRDAPLEAAHRLSARLALRQLLPMVRPTARGIAASLADGDHVHDLVEAALPGKRESVPDHLAAGSFNWRHACVGSEVSLARKARDVADHSHDLRCQDRPDAEDLGERGTGGLHLNSDALVEFRYPSIQGTHVSHHLGGQASADSSCWMLGPSAAQQLGGGIGAELLLDRIGEEVSQEYVEAVEGAGAFGD
jgi:hypothetical protein